jgi:hypothetical protein
VLERGRFYVLGVPFSLFVRWVVVAEGRVVIRRRNLFVGFYVAWFYVLLGSVGCGDVALVYALAFSDACW